MGIEVHRLAWGLGAEIRGVSPRDPIDEDTLQEIKAAWREHLVLLIRDVEMSTDQHIAFTRRFGELELHGDKGLRGNNIPELFRVTNRVTEGKRSNTADVGREWHSDGSFTPRPSGGSMLHCRAMPSVGGNTLFTNMYMAYETLSETVKKIVDRLSVVNDVSLAPEYQLMDPHQVAQSIIDNPPVVHPMVRVHPETGRKALYVSPMLTREIHGMTRAESAGLLNYLYQHATQPEFGYRHSWQVGDLILWDNRCTMHLAPKDYDHSELRDMCRTTLRGEIIGRFLNALPQQAAA